MRTSRHRNRRGITLLFVVSLIVLFLLMGTAFVIVSNDFLKSARKRSKLRLTGDRGHELIERALYDVIRGPDLDNALSPLRTHSLLEDMYGYGLKATVATATAEGSQHFIRLTLQNMTTILDGAAFTPDPIPGLFNGLILTIVSGDENGLTTRIVEHQFDGTTHTFLVQPVWSDDGMVPTNPAALLNARVVINGRPFSGTGAGLFNPFVPATAPALSNQALSPNRRGQTRTQLIQQYLGEVPAPGNPAVANHRATNESYDAFDEQNMFLGGIDAFNGGIIVPSFYRPNPLMTGPSFSATGSTALTVDNDADGIPDGFWMDIGLPIQTDESGRRYKPLVSYFITDMDGRINVNAHGNLSQIDANARFMTDMNMYGAAGAPMLHRGQGYGPAEISLDALFGPAGEQALMVGAGAFEGRYGFDDLPGDVIRDPWSSYKLFGLPDGPSSPVPQIVGRHYFSSAMDIDGRFATGYVDAPGMYDPNYGTFPIGMPVAAVASSNRDATLGSEVANSAYESSFAPEPFRSPGLNTIDFQYSLRELERLLRPYDPDTFMLPDRLYQLAQVGTWTPANLADRFAVTTDSYEVPTTYRSLASDLYEALNRFVPAATPNRDQVIRNNLLAMLAPELLRGLPLDVNRPFGDAQDNDGNGVIDDVGESFGAESILHPAGAVGFDHDNDGITGSDPDAYLARHYFARHLYIMALLTTQWVDRNGDGTVNASDWIDFDQDGSPPTADADDLILFRRVIAQWAVNVADFRDPDSIMTPFEVDLNPWDGWDVDGDISTDEGIADRFVCWGMERPELIITETLATHDRRTEDTTADSTGDDVAGGDDDYDSRLVPVASAFFELYNPWVQNAANQIFPAELYGTNGGITGVDLQRTTPAGDPVWRIVVADADATMRAWDPDDPTHPNNNGGSLGGSNTVDFLRRIYFTQPANDSGPRVYFPNSSVNVASLAPGRYAVIGSGGIQNGGDYTTYFGRRTTGAPLTELNDTRRITLRPAANELVVYSSDGAGGVIANSITNTICIPIDEFDVPGTKRALGLSDPINGYVGLADPATGDPVIQVPIADGFEFQNSVTMAPVTFDEPVDSQLQNAEWLDKLQYEGVWEDPATTTTAFRLVYLQRLANPLDDWDAVTNPYRTIDSNSVDLFTFNGADDASAEPENPPRAQIMRFGTFERRSNDTTVQQAQDTGSISKRFRMLWKTDWDGKNPQNDLDSPPIATDMHHLNRDLRHSLGRLNEAYRNALAAGPVTELPFSWLQWNNRPFASHLELANVPMTSSFWLGSKFDNSEQNRNVYAPPVRGTGPSMYTGSEQYASHFPHLINMYSDGVNNGLWLQRMMDYVRVPSRFVGTESYVNPATFSGTTFGMNNAFAPPFDSLSNYREPGKVNINTVTDERVWNAVMAEYGLSTTYQDWARSRARNGTTNAIDVTNPYRSAEAFNWVSQPASVVPPAETGLFRRRVDSGGTPTDIPLFDYDSGNTWEDTTRGAYFKYDMRQRLGNLVTTRSSVFAIWITVGYFEVDATGAPIAELGADTGDTTRHRGFFIVDRSIPVAAEPGKNHNVERMIKVATFIDE